MLKLLRSGAIFLSVAVLVALAVLLARRPPTNEDEGSHLVPAAATVDSHLPEPTDSSISEMTPPPSQPTTVSEPSASSHLTETDKADDLKLQRLQEENASLRRQVEELKVAQIASIEKPAASPINPSIPYIGPGVWANQNARTLGLKEFTVLQTGEGLFITGRASCAPTDCEWPAVPLIIYPGRTTQERRNRRALAYWSFPQDQVTLVIVFDADDVRAEIYHNLQHRTIENFVEVSTFNRVR